MTSKNPREILKEQFEDKKIGVIIYLNDVTPNGPLNSSFFEFECIFEKNNGKYFHGRGIGNSKKEAQHNACQDVIDQLTKFQIDDENQLPSTSKSSSSSQLPNDGNTSSPSRPKLHNDGQTYVISSSSRPELYNDGQTYVVSSPPSSNSSSNGYDSVMGNEETVVIVDNDSADIINEAVDGNRIGDLQIYCDKNKVDQPQYIMEELVMLDKSKKFIVTCKLQGFSEKGVAVIKMTAKKIAAYKMLQNVQRGVLNALPKNGKCFFRVIPVQIMFMKLQQILFLNMEQTAKSVNQSVVNFPLPAPIPKVNGIEKRITSKIVYFENIILGEGGTSKVYEGYFESKTRRAAIKVCPIEIAHHDKNKELDIMRKLRNEHIISYYVTEDIGPLSYIVMELAMCSLEDIIKSIKPIADVDLKKYLKDATKGLVYLHSEKIVHRDMKPSNVLVFSDNTAKLADFGISRELDSVTQGAVTESYRGTYIYMPPEGLRSIGTAEQFVLVPSFDIFSLGLTIFATMTRGKHLFAFELHAPFEIQANIIKDKPNWESISENNHFALRNLLKAMVLNKPDKRPTSSCILEHPFFWNFRKGLEFVDAVNNDLKNNKDAGTINCRSEMNQMYDRYCGSNSRNWKIRLHTKLQEFLAHKDKLRAENGKINLDLKPYKEHNFVKLIEFIRDHYPHYESWNTFANGALKDSDIFGPDGRNYAEYFMKTFPELTTLLYTFFQEDKYRGLYLNTFYNENIIPEKYFEKL